MTDHEYESQRLLSCYSENVACSDDEDARSPYRRDRDRIYYSEEFQRLENVTQVAPGDSPKFHNRLTHSLKVEQTAKCIVLQLRKKYASNKIFLDRINEDVVAAASLAHDIGHPPFGHNGEKTLQECMEQSNPSIEFDGCSDSFEGNAQTFHIISLLAEKSNASVEMPLNSESGSKEEKVVVCAGLNLTKRVLAASIKYPWFKGMDTSDFHDSNKKWGAYEIDMPAFKWVLDNATGANAKSIEADIMDYADDIAYAVHDVEDFYRAGVIPLEEFYLPSINSTIDTDLFDRFMSYAESYEQKFQQDTEHGEEGNYALLKACQQYSEYQKLRRGHSNNINDLVKSNASVADRRKVRNDNLQVESDFLKNHDELRALVILRTKFPRTSFSESRSTIESLGGFRSYVLSTCINNDLQISADRDGSRIEKPSNAALYIEFLKQLTWFYVINNNRHWSVKQGQQETVRSCFNALYRLAHAAWFTENKERSDGTDSCEYSLPEGNSITVHGVPPRLISYYMANRAMKLKINGFVNHFENKKDVEYVIARSVCDYMCTLSDQELYQIHSEITGNETPSAFIRTLL